MKNPNSLAAHSRLNCFLVENTFCVSMGHMYTLSLNHGVNL